MPAAVARKAGKRSVSKAKKVKNVGLKRTKGVCMPTVPSSAHFKRMCCGNTARTRSHARLCPGKLCGRQLLGSGPINKSSNATGLADQDATTGGCESGDATDGLEPGPLAALHRVAVPKFGSVPLPCARGRPRST